MPPSGLPKQALEHADNVSHAAGATYLDEVFAYIGAASAHAQLDDKAQTTLSIEAAVVRALDVGDVVAIALATNAYQHLIGRPHPAFDQPTQLESGWLTVIGNRAPAGPAEPVPPGSRNQPASVSRRRHGSSAKNLAAAGCGSIGRSSSLGGCGRPLGRGPAAHLASGAPVQQPGVLAEAANFDRVAASPASLPVSAIDGQA